MRANPSKRSICVPHLVSGRIECKSIPNHDDLIDHLPAPDRWEDHEGKATGVTACRSQTLFCRMWFAELLNPRADCAGDMGGSLVSFWYYRRNLCGKRNPSLREVEPLGLNPTRLPHSTRLAMRTQPPPSDARSHCWGSPALVWTSDSYNVPAINLSFHAPDDLRPLRGQRNQICCVSIHIPACYHRCNQLRRAVAIDVPQ